MCARETTVKNTSMFPNFWKLQPKIINKYSIMLYIHLVSSLTF